MRLEESTLKQRTLCFAIVVLLLAPLASAARLPVPRMASSSPPVLHAEDILAGLTAESARASGSLAWHHDAGWYVTEAVKSATGKLTLVVEGIDVLAFRYDAPRDAALGIQVDGVTMKWLPAGNDAPFDLPLDGKRHTIAWSVVAAAGDLLGVRVEGIHPIADPVTLEVPTSLLLCAEEDLVLRVGWARALGPEALRVAIDGAPAAIEGVDVKRAWNVVETMLRVPVPPQDAQRRDVHVLVEATLPDGRVVRLVDGLIEVALRVAVLWDLPSGWEYDRTPSIGAVSLCPANPIVGIALAVDGQDVTSRMEPTLLGAFYTFDRELEFREEHAYVLEAKLRHGPAFRFERAFVEGLDVMELDAQLGYIEFARTSRVWTMLAPTNLDALPPVHATPPPGTLFGVQTIPLQSDAHLRAVYAPLAIRCDPLLGVCDPYGGLAPGFGPEDFTETTLTVTGRGATTTYPTLGQMVAASHMSRVALPPTEALLPDA